MDNRIVWVVLAVSLGACGASGGVPSGGGGGGGGADAGGGGGGGGGSPTGPSADGHWCGIWMRGRGICTECAIAQCCAQSAACGEDQACVDCVGLALAGDVLGQQERGCSQNAGYAALSACINDRNACGPICNPGEGCGAVSCTSDSRCTSLGCTSCGGTGRCQ
jgi:hypothetical protein